MEIKTRHIGATSSRPAIIIELTVKTNSSSITEDITERDNRVSKDFIQQLRDLADELDAHNREVFCEEKGIGF